MKVIVRGIRLLLAGICAVFSAPAIHAAEGYLGGLSALGGCVDGCLEGNPDSEKQCTHACMCILGLDTDTWKRDLGEIGSGERTKACAAKAFSKAPTLPETKPMPPSPPSNGKLSRNNIGPLVSDGQTNYAVFRTYDGWQGTPIFVMLSAPELKGQKIVYCEYEVDAEWSGAYYFWYEHAPKNINQMIAADPKGVLRETGTAIATGCPVSQLQAEKIRREGTAAYRK